MGPFASNEFGTTVRCGNSFALDGPQLYHEIALTNGKSYTVTFKADFGARVYVFAKTCDAKLITSRCAKTGVPGVLLSTNVAKSFTVTAAQTGPYLIAVDSRAPDWHGSYRIDVKSKVP